MYYLNTLFILSIRDTFGLYLRFPDILYGTVIKDDNITKRSFNKLQYGQTVEGKFMKYMTDVVLCRTVSNTVYKYKLETSRLLYLFVH